MGKNCINFKTPAMEYPMFNVTMARQCGANGCTAARLVQCARYGYMVKLGNKSFKLFYMATDDVELTPGVDDFAEWWITDWGYLGRHIGGCRAGIMEAIDKIAARGLVELKQTGRVWVYTMPWLIDWADGMATR